MIFNGSLQSRAVHRRRDRWGFTLIELLVAITIMLIVFAMTAGVVSLAINTDRIPSSSRTIQAALLGARDRAIRAGRAVIGEKPRRGVRFVLNPNHNHAVGSLVYIGNQDDWSQGTITIDSTNARQFTLSQSWPSVFKDDTEVLGVDAQPGVASVDDDSVGGNDDFGEIGYPGSDDQSDLLEGSRIEIPKDSGSWYRVSVYSHLTPSAQTGLLSRNFSGGSLGPHEYRLQLPSEILSNEQPLPLDANVAINLDISRSNNGIPSSWWDSVNSKYIQGNMEIQFTPEGNVFGPASAYGAIYLYLCTIDDILNNRLPADPARGEALVIKITPQTGQVQSFPVNPDNTDPFKFAKQ